MNPNYNDLARVAHEAAVKAGFCEKPQADAARLMLIITEIAEAEAADIRRQQLGIPKAKYGLTAI